MNVNENKKMVVVPQDFFMLHTKNDKSYFIYMSKTFLNDKIDQNTNFDKLQSAKWLLLYDFASYFLALQL